MAWISIPRVSRSAGRLRFVAAAAALFAVGCQSLEVTNTNDPDTRRALATGGDIKALVGGAYFQWYSSMQRSAPAMTVSTMADAYTSSWGNDGMRAYSAEPRVALFNSPTERADILQAFQGPWYGNYSAVVSANLAIKAIDGGVNIDITDASQTPMVRAAARFLQGAGLSNISLYYDQGFIVDETTDVAALTFSTHQEIRDAALVKLDATIALAGATTFQLPDVYLNHSGWTNIQLAQVANTIAARTIAYSARTDAENTAADWARVVSYASKGISSGARFDPSITGDAGVAWEDGYKAYGNYYSTWARVDMRIVCLLDPAQPCRHPNNATQIGRPVSLDYRFNGGVVGGNDTQYSDFVWDPVIPHNPARGYYHFSEVGHQRWLGYSWESATPLEGVVPFMLAAENDLLWAEGLVRTNTNLALAATLINNSRVGRGHLTPATAADGATALINDIFYERSIELLGVSGCVDWYDARRTTGFNATTFTGRGLQVGTARHFPVPAKELLVLQQEIYTFGGPSLPDMSVTAGGSASSRGIFGESGGREIVGPGQVGQIADDLFAASSRAHRSRQRM